VNEHETLKAIAMKIEWRLDEIAEALHRMGDALLGERAKIEEICNEHERRDN